jgi:hypothetical protein
LEEHTLVFSQPPSVGFFGGTVVLNQINLATDSELAEVVRNILRELHIKVLGIKDDSLQPDEDVVSLFHMYEIKRLPKVQQI